MDAHLVPIGTVHVAASVAAVVALVLMVSAASRRWRLSPAVVWTVAGCAILMAAMGHLWLPERTLGGQPMVTQLSYAVLAFSATVTALALPVTAAGGRWRRLSRLAARLVVVYGVVAVLAGFLWLHMGPQVDAALGVGGPAYVCQAPEYPGAHTCS